MLARSAAALALATFTVVTATAPAMAQRPDRRPEFPRPANFTLLAENAQVAYVEPRYVRQGRYLFTVRVTVNRDGYAPQRRLEVGAYSFVLVNDERPGGPWSSRRPSPGMERVLPQPCELRYLDAGQTMTCDLLFE